MDLRDRECGSLPDIWRRSLTESGMRRAATRGDRIVVAAFLVCLVAIALTEMPATILPS